MNADGAAWFANLCCPVCKKPLARPDEERFACPKCGKEFPRVHGCPVLLHEDASVFRIADFLTRKPTTFRRGGTFQRLANKWLPRPNRNLKARKNYKLLETLLLQNTEKPIILIIGGGELGQGLDAIITNNAFEFVQSDVALEPGTELVCDCHDLPFPDAFFDAIISQAVLEHVLDPFRCMDEMHRVLKTRGLLYVEVPFLQPVHGGKYDFTRFTDLGLRRLCRKFEEIDRGAMCGAGMALAGIYLAFLKNLARSNAARKALAVFGRITSCWMKYFDYYTIDTPAGLDAASGLFFLGRKNDSVLADRDLLDLYKGASGGERNGSQRTV